VRASEERRGRERHAIPPFGACAVDSGSCVAASAARSRRFISCPCWSHMRSFTSNVQLRALQRLHARAGRRARLVAAVVSVAVVVVDLVDAILAPPSTHTFEHVLVGRERRRPASRATATAAAKPYAGLGRTALCLLHRQRALTCPPVQVGRTRTGGKVANSDPWRAPTACVCGTSECGRRCRTPLLPRATAAGVETGPCCTCVQGTALRRSGQHAVPAWSAGAAYGPSPTVRAAQRSTGRAAAQKTTTRWRCRCLDSTIRRRSIRQQPGCRWQCAQCTPPPTRSSARRGPTEAPESRVQGLWECTSAAQSSLGAVSWQSSRMVAVHSSASAQLCPPRPEAKRREADYSTHEHR